jgi:hypothetical protein
MMLSSSLTPEKLSFGSTFRARNGSFDLLGSKTAFDHTAKEKIMNPFQFRNKKSVINSDSSNNSFIEVKIVNDLRHFKSPEKRKSKRTSSSIT